MTKSSPVVAIVLSGCGVYDGAEIQEAVMTMLAVERNGGTYQCFAPNIPQHHVINHLTGQEETGATRNVMTEAARIARGNIKDIREYTPDAYDALMFPGGFGVAKNLCTFALDGPECRVNPDIEALVKATVAANRPIGALCIAPALMARIMGDGVNVTIGQDADVAQGIEAMGGVHTQTTHGEVIVDSRRKLATTPCYMLDATLSQIADGAENVVRAVFEMIAD